MNHCIFLKKKEITPRSHYSFIIICIIGYAQNLSLGAVGWICVILFSRVDYVQIRHGSMSVQHAMLSNVKTSKDIIGAVNI